MPHASLVSKGLPFDARQLDAVDRFLATKDKKVETIQVETQPFAMLMAGVVLANSVVIGHLGHF